MGRGRPASLSPRLRMPEPASSTMSLPSESVTRRQEVLPLKRFVEAPRGWELSRVRPTHLDLHGVASTARHPAPEPPVGPVSRRGPWVSIAQVVAVAMGLPGGSPIARGVVVSVVSPKPNARLNYRI